MATYEFCCADHGVFQLRRPMGQAPRTADCAVCGARCHRVYSAPMVARGRSAASAAIERAEKSRDEPEVVTALPPRRSGTRIPAAAVNPAIRKLPRP